MRINQDKTEIVLFTRKYKSRLNKEVSVSGIPRPYAEIVKYLGDTWIKN